MKIRLSRFHIQMYKILIFFYTVLYSSICFYVINHHIVCVFSMRNIFFLSPDNLHGFSFKFCCKIHIKIFYQVMLMQIYTFSFLGLYDNIFLIIYFFEVHLHLLKKENQMYAANK